YGAPPGGSVTFTQQPASVNAQLGQTVTFTTAATAVGTTGQPTWQWYRNNVAIEGAVSASYTTPPLSLYDIGTNVYTVRVSPGGVFAASEPAELTVAAPPPEPATAYSRRVLEHGALLYWNFDEFTGDADQLAPRATQLPERAEN